MGDLPDPVVLIVALAALGILPFLAVMVTSFVKLVVIFFLIRNALGIQGIPPNIALHGLAIILTVYIMAPVGLDVYDRIKDQALGEMDAQAIFTLVEDAAQPFKAFLLKHANPKERAFFVESAKAIWPEELAARLTPESILVLIPSFTVSELTSAFEIGFLIYLPFLAIDLIISNILLAMGMMMVSPMTISLPFKLLLFVLVDGWARLIHGVVLTYQ